jgi:hypothetical protein
MDARIKSAHDNREAGAQTLIVMAGLDPAIHEADPQRWP